MMDSHSSAKPRTVPYAIDKKWDMGLRKLVENWWNGVLKKSEALGQHPPIVVLPKADKLAKICGD